LKINLCFQDICSSGFATTITGRTFAFVRGKDYVASIAIFSKLVTYLLEHHFKASECKKKPRKMKTQLLNKHKSPKSKANRETQKQQFVLLIWPFNWTGWCQGPRHGTGNLVN